MTTADLLRSGWVLRPLVLLACAGAAGLHVARGGLSSPRRTGALALALILLVLSLSSPLDALAAGYLFSAHMLQHLLLVLGVPALALLSLPPARGATPALDCVSRWLRARPVITWGAGIGAMWLWHAQTLCNAASQSDTVRGLQSVSLLAMGALFYWPLLGPRRALRMSALAGMVYLFTACVGCTLLGIVITLSPIEVCPAFLHPADGMGLIPLIRDGWGISAAEDQQLGGLLMWVPACAVYLGGIVGQLARFYAGKEESAR